MKNHYDPEFDAATEAKGYRAILANYLFEPGRTWGDFELGDEVYEDLFVSFKEDGAERLPFA